MDPLNTVEIFAAYLASVGVESAVATDICNRAFELYSDNINEWHLDLDDPYLLLVEAKLTCSKTSRSCGSDKDFLGRNVHRKTFARALSLSERLFNKKRNLGPALVVTVRNEGPLIVDWVSHHIACGFKRIFVYTNDNNDESGTLLDALELTGAITVVQNPTAADVNPQLKAYEHSLHCLDELLSYKWVMYLDADEFFIPSRKFNFDVNVLVEAAERSSSLIPSISINWMWYGSGGQIKLNERHVFDRFEYGHPFSNFVKSLVIISECYSMMHVHKPLLRKLSLCGVDSNFDEINMVGHGIEFNFEGGEIRHYWNKSFEEFLVKQRRGIDRADWFRKSDLFFDWDVPALAINYRPVPEIVKERAFAAAKVLRVLPKIELSEKVVFDSYRKLVMDIIGNSDLCSTYQKIDAKYQIKEKLKSLLNIDERSVGLSDFAKTISTKTLLNLCIKADE